MKTTLTEKNPFTETYDTDTDVLLVKEALGGDLKALEELIDRHNGFIYNIAMKMSGNVADTEDITQEILIKLITNLASYNPQKAQFRTWLYRITFNYVLNYKKSPQEARVTTFENLFNRLDQIEDEEMSDEEAERFDPIGQESKILCMSGLLMCLSREQRLIYILGTFFEIDHTLGAEIFNISKGNFRMKLSRARQELHQWMHNRCGLVNKANACRCRKKTKAFIEKGIIDPEEFIWNQNFSNKINAYVKGNLDEVTTSLDSSYIRMYQEHPFKDTKKAAALLSKILNEKTIKNFLNFNT